MSESKVTATGIDRKYKKPTLTRILALTSGMVVWNMMYTAQGQIQLFALSVLGIEPLLVTIFITIFTVVDIVNDPIIGRYSDKSTRFTKRFGKRFIFLIVANLGMIIFLILQFLPWPIKVGGGLASENLILLAVIWLTLSSSLFDCFQTFNEMNTEALNQDLMRDPESRRRLFLVRIFTETLLGLLLGIILVPMLLSAFHAFDASGKADNPNAFFMMAIVVALIALIAVPIRAWGIWEPKEMREFRAELDKQVQRPPFWQVVKRCITDRSWLANMVQAVWWGIVARVFTVGISFYVIISLGLNIGMSIIPQAIMIIAFVVSGVLAYILMRKKGTKFTIMLGIAITIVSFFVMVFSTNIWDFSVYVIFGALGIGLMNTATGVSRAEAIDESVLKHGTREEASYYSVQGVFKSISNVIQSFILTIIIFAFGIDMTAGYAGNTPLARFGLLFNISIVICITTIILGIAFSKLYKITPEMAEANKQKLLELGR